MVYIDELCDYGVMIGRCGPLWCHMIADTIEELHAFAVRLDLRKEWFQDKEHFPHYDLTKRKRAQAVRLGASQSYEGFRACTRKWHRLFKIKQLMRKVLVFEQGHPFLFSAYLYTAQGTLIKKLEKREEIEQYELSVYEGDRTPFEQLKTTLGYSYQLYTMRMKDAGPKVPTT